MADCAEYGDPPPPELTQAFQVDQWGASAVYSRPISASQLRRMTACLNVYRAVKAFTANSINVTMWAERNPGLFAIVADIRDLRRNG